NTGGNDVEELLHDDNTSMFANSIRYMLIVSARSQFTLLMDLHQRGALSTVSDAFLAEVRSQGVEMFAASLGSPYVERGEECYQDGYTHAIERIKCHKAPEFAAQVRKGVQS
ncbi:MAG: hypothetical protein E7E83_19610, partial [Enterobacter ludwigii]|nr:hypothetical protein [Enterobacter ludwigii]